MLRLARSAPSIRHALRWQCIRAASHAAPVNGSGKTATAAHSKAHHQPPAKPPAPRKQFDPKLIYPSKPGIVRICNNTTRDAQQSNLSAEMAHVHRIEIARLIDACYAKTQGPPGVEQIWGGTIPLFDIWKRGVHPFDGLREMTELLPNTPTSMLVRSNSLNSMNSQPRDVVESFIAQSAKAGVDVFTNFDANNDVRNHRAVAEAVHKAGKHYQAALSWAVVHADPTIYNVKWAVQWFRTIVRDLQPHSIYIKDPSGVLTPEMAGVLSRELKAEFPDLPLIFHSHYQTGFAYASYLEALRAGANGVECSLGFPDGAGQPYGLTLLRMCEDYGLDTGSPDKAAWSAVATLCRDKLQPLYAQGNRVRTPDIAVEYTGIAGGQRSILDKELRDAGQAHLIPQVDELAQQVRLEGGLVCQVTPAADSYVREAMRRLRGGDPAHHFAPGYAQILVGENGGTKEPVNEKQRQAALDERVSKKLSQLVAEGKVTQQVADALLHGVASLNGSATKDVKFASSPLGMWRARMEELSAPVIAHQRLAEVSTRLEELAAIQKNPELLKSLEIKVARAAANAKEGSVERGVKTLADRVKVLQRERGNLEANLKGQGSKEAVEEAYHSVLLGSASELEYAKFIALSPITQKLYASNVLTLQNVKDLLSAAGQITCSSSLLLAPGLEKARSELQAFESEHLLGLLDSPQKAEENTLLWACFSRTAIANLLANFFQHYYTFDVAGYFPRLFKGDKESSDVTLQEEFAKQEAASAFMYRNVHEQVESVLKGNKEGAATMRKVQELHQQALRLEMRAKRWEDGSHESARIAPETKAKLRERIDSLRAEAAHGQQQLEQLVLQHFKLHPGRLQQKLPVFDEQTAHVRFARAEEVVASADGAANAAHHQAYIAQQSLHDEQQAVASLHSSNTSYESATTKHASVSKGHGRGHTFGKMKPPSAEAEEFAVAKHALKQIIHHK